jgi:hypothetical protein
VPVSIMIVLLGGATNLSRTYQRNMLELESGEPNRADSQQEGVVQPAGPR